jgi:hypothetical protein
LRKGCEWTYTGQVEWTINTQVFATNIQWTMKIIDVAKGPAAQTAMVRGFVSDLAWYEPPAPPQFTVIAKIQNRVYLISSQSEAEAHNQFRAIAQHGVNADAEPWLDLPLFKDKRWAFNPERTDLFYCWRVEDDAIQRNTLRKPNSIHNIRTWNVAYRSNPDHQIFTIADEAGIVAYEFAHHGTVASAKVVLSDLSVPHD